MSVLSNKWQNNRYCVRIFTGNKSQGRSTLIAEEQTLAQMKFNTMVALKKR